MKVMIDMFSGLGGASEAFINDDKWIVARYDNNPLLKTIHNTIITDSMFNDIVDDFPFSNLELVWASPPCREFSDGFNSPVSKMRRNEEGFEDFIPDLELLEKTLGLIEFLKPRYWVIENVIGAIKYFKPLVGAPTQIIGSQVLWGNFPYIHIPPGFKENKFDKDKGSSNPLRSNYRAIIPYEISAGLKKTIEEQRQLTEWI